MRKRARRREHSEDGIKIIRNKHLKLTLEIGGGPGYSFHTGEIKGRAVSVQVFNPGPTVRERLDMSRRECSRWNTAEGPLAAALQEDHTRSITLGFKMVAGLASGVNHLSVQGISLGSLRAENFDVFLDIDDRFLISISPTTTEIRTTAQQQTPGDTDASWAWAILNSLCQKVLRSANQVLHNENIERNSVIPDMPRRPPDLHPSSAAVQLGPHLPSSSQNMDAEALVPPRREYVWRTILLEHGQPSLTAIATRIVRDLEMTSVNKVALSDGGSVHRCAGYVREEITLTTTTSQSAVIFHDSPSPREICAVCHEVVGTSELFRCVCGDQNPGSRPTVKCQICKFWSHRNCVENSTGFVCESCDPGADCLSPLEVRVFHPLPAMPDRLSFLSPNVGLHGIQLIETAADSFRREVNEWRRRSGVPTIEDPVRSDGLTTTQQVQLMKMESASLRREANEWRTRAGVQIIEDLSNPFNPIPSDVTPHAERGEVETIFDHNRSSFVGVAELLGDESAPDSGTAPHPHAPDARPNTGYLDEEEWSHFLDVLRPEQTTDSARHTSTDKDGRAAISSRSAFFQEDVDDDSDGEPKKKKRGRKPKSVLDDFATPPPTDVDVDQSFPDPVQLWSSDDKALFLDLLAQHGENFRRIALIVVQTSVQVAEYFKSNYADLDLASVLPKASLMDGDEAPQPVHVGRKRARRIGQVSSSSTAIPV
ncbi:hypothetical protein C8R47DRAFT_1193894 [Mycena vitilis]|nr:hypothetical protein C8R47DRAFT_1193894 [Mycena vitilis]